MLKNLHKLVIKSYLGPLIMTFFIAEFVLMMHFLWLYIGDLVGRGLEWSLILELLGYASARLVKLALPLAVLLASIMTFGNMGEHFELSAMKSAGISLQRIMMPLIVFSILISVGSFYFANYVIPYTNLKMGALIYDIGNKRPEMNIQPGVFNNNIPNFSIKISGKNPDSNMMYDFMIYDHREKRGNTEVTLADSGTMEVTGDQKYMIITLYGGKSYKEREENDPKKKARPENHSYFNKQTTIFKLEGLDMERTDENIFKFHHDMLPNNQLTKSRDSLSHIHKKRRINYVHGLVRTKYFKYERKNTGSNDSIFIEKDSLLKLRRPEELVSILNIDSLFKLTSKTDKNRILEAALENAKNTKKYIDSNKEDLYGRKKIIHKHDVAWHEKFSLSFACLIFFFIGAPLGAIIRKGGFGLPFLVSIIFFLIYYVVSLMGKKLVEEGVLPAWQGMWISSALTLPLGALFTYKATTDSAIFDVASYVALIKKPFKFLDIEYRDPSNVFHKNVIVPDSMEIKNHFEELLCASNKIKEKISNIKSSGKKLFAGHFKQTLPELEGYTALYNQLYSILAVKYRNNKFLMTSMLKMPKIIFDNYKLSKNNSIFNYLLLYPLIVPVGLLLLLRASLKYNVLKQKIELVETALKQFEEIIDEDRKQIQ